jgi:hypothetical protein
MQRWIIIIISAVIIGATDHFETWPSGNLSVIFPSSRLRISSFFSEVLNVILDPFATSSF